MWLRKQQLQLRGNLWRCEAGSCSSRRMNLPGQERTRLYDTIRLQGALRVEVSGTFQYQAYSQWKPEDENVKNLSQMDVSVEVHPT